MNRSILYRGFHECANGTVTIIINDIQRRGNWVCGFPSHHITKDFWCIENEQGEYVDVISETVGESTGKIDKNGVNIFEDDIVKTNNGRLCKVVWFSSDCHCGWDFIPIEADNPAPEQFCAWRGSENEVVSNVFDNHDLFYRRLKCKYVG